MTTVIARRSVRAVSRAACLGLLEILVLAGCGGATGSPAASVPASVQTSALPPSGPTATASASPSAAVTPSQPAPIAAEGLCATDQQPCPIDAGTYTTLPFVPAFTFTVDDGWSSDRLFADGGQVSKGNAAFVWASGVETGMANGEEVEIGPSVDDFITHLERFDGWDLTAPIEVVLGGESAVQIDVTTNDTAAPGIYLVKADAMNLTEGEKARFLLLDLDGITVILILDAYAEADFDAFVAATEPLVASIAWQ